MENLCLLEDTDVAVMWSEYFFHQAKKQLHFFMTVSVLLIITYLKEMYIVVSLPGVAENGV